MTALSIQPTFPIFTDIDGQPLEDGYVFIGTANLNPITNPITVYWDAALTLAAVQPIRTLGGYPMNSGTPARLYVNSDYSIQVQNKNGSLIYSAPAATERYGNIIISSADVSFLQAGTSAVTRTAQAKMRETVSVKDFGAVGNGVADDTLAVQSAINAIAAAGGGVVLFPQGTYGVTSTITISSNNTTLQGQGDGTQIKYIGSAQIDYLLYGAATATENIIIQDMRLLGGNFQLGKVKWVLYMEEFHRECVLRNLVIREGLGLLNLQACYYGKMENVQCIQTVPNPQTQGWSLADWQDVYGTGTAPIYFGGNGGATQIDRFTISKVGSELHTGNTGQNIVLFDRASCMVNSMSYEACCVDYDGFSPRTVNGIQVYFSWCTFNNFYTELTGAETRQFYAAGRGQMIFNSAFIYQFNGGSGSRLFDNDSTHEIVVNNAEIYRISADLFARQSGSFSGGGVAFQFNNCVTATGERYTDASVNAQTENTYDTRGSINKLGMPDVSVFPTNPRDSLFPQKNIGLVVTSGSDANGAFVQATAGVLMNDRGNLVNTRIPTSSSFSTMVVYKLRPQTASRYYRLFMGIGGNFYLTESATPYTDDRGNWLAGFQTDGSGAIISLADNPRLSYRGTYTNGKARFNLGFGSAPASGNWNGGDTAYFNDPQSNVGYMGWVCTFPGAPGTWQKFGMIIGVTQVALLPSAATAGAGATAVVIDANATTFASIVAGGGGSAVPVYSDGTNWRIG
jgi:hypothetical protein